MIAFGSSGAAPASAVRARDPRVGRIVVTGTESTGKTTLARDLAGVLGGVWVPEYAREYAERAARPLLASDVEPIARGQIAAEAAAEARALDAHALDASAADSNSLDKNALDAHPLRDEPNDGGRQPLLVLDTDLVSTTVYAEHYYGACPPWIMEAASARAADLYLLTALDLPWAADGVRDQPTARAQLQERFAARLGELRVLVLGVGGTGIRRLENAVAAVRGWRAATAARDLARSRERST